MVYNCQWRFLPFALLKQKQRCASAKLKMQRSLHFFTLVRPAGSASPYLPLHGRYRFRISLRPADSLRYAQPFRFLHASKAVCLLGRTKFHFVQFCPPGRNRTCDPLLKRELLYQLSYGRIYKSI